MARCVNGVGVCVPWLIDVDAAVGKVWAAMPRNSMLILATGVGDSPRWGEEEEEWREFPPSGDCFKQRTRVASHRQLIFFFTKKK